MKALKKFSAAMPAMGGQGPAMPPSSMGGLPAAGQNPAQAKVEQQQQAQDAAQGAAPDANPQIMAANQAAEQATASAEQQVAQVSMEAQQQIAASQQEASNQLALQQQTHAEELMNKDKEIRAKDIDIQLAQAEAKLAEKSKDLDIKGMQTSTDDVTSRVDKIRSKLNKSAMEKQLPTNNPAPPSQLLPPGTLDAMNKSERTRYTNNEAYMPFRHSRVSYGGIGDFLFNNFGRNYLYGPSQEYLQTLGANQPSLRPGQMLKQIGMQALQQLR